MLLEAIEDKRRTDFSEGSACERDLTVEHVMPLGWRAHWAPEGVDAATAVLRDTLIHTLGNLTLVRWKLNEALADLPWTDADAAAAGLGPTGKRSELSRHSLLKINAELVAGHPDAWTEATIAARTAELAGVIAEVFPRQYAPAPLAATTVPAVPAAAPAEPGSTVDSGAATGSRYGRLTEFLKLQTADTVPMTFEQVQDVLDDALPPAARTNIPYWSSGNVALGRAIAAGGFKPTNVDLWNERVIFARDTQPSQPRRARPHPKRRAGGRQGGLDR
jgi:hypothetical protein